MIPTEHEYTVATQAAAKKLLSLSRPDLDWDEDLDPNERRAMMEPILPIVDAAISAIPDRAEALRTDALARFDATPTQEILEILPFSTIPELSHVDDVRELFAKVLHVER